MKILEWLAYFFGWIFGTAKRYYVTPMFVEFLLGLLLLFVMAWLIFRPTAASAEEAKCEAVLGGWSYHQDRERNYNETHDTIGLECNDWMLITYNNSLSNRSIFVGRSIESSDTGFSYGVQYGLINGYDHGSSSPYPIAFPKVSYNMAWGGVDVLVMPGVVTYANLKFHLRDYTPTKRKASKYAGAVGYGSTGRSLSVSRYLTPKFDVTLLGSAESLEVERDGEPAARTYNIEADFLTLRVNYYPWRGDFFIAAGVAKNKSSIKVQSKPVVESQEVHIKRATRIILDNFPEAERIKSFPVLIDSLVGTATVEVEMPEFSPYLGVGWGNPWINNRRLSMSVDLGAYYINGIEFKGSVDSPLVEAFELQDEVQARMDEQVDKLQSQYSDIKWWWNVAVNVRYRF